MRRLRIRVDFGTRRYGATCSQQRSNRQRGNSQQSVGRCCTHVLSLTEAHEVGVVVGGHLFQVLDTLLHLHRVREQVVPVRFRRLVLSQRLLACRPQQFEQRLGAGTWRAGAPELHHLDCQLVELLRHLLVLPLERRDCAHRTVARFRQLLVLLLQKSTAPKASSMRRMYQYSRTSHGVGPSEGEKRAQD